MPEDAEKKKPELGKVGPALKVRRQALRMSLAQVEHETKIRGKFLTAFESGDYSSLPNDVYSRGFVQHYANHLGLDGPKVAADYAEERGGVAAGETKAPRLERPGGPVFTGRLLAVALGLLAILAVLGYLLVQLTSLAAAPQLTVSTPGADEVVSGEVTTVSGHSTPGTDVTVDGSAVLSDTDGNFSEKVALQNGVNAIRVTAKSKLGKSTTVVRDVLAKLPPVDSKAGALPASTFDGVAVEVKVTDTTSIVVLVDGQEQFRGTFVAGKSMVFTGKTDVNLTTGNAGVTSVTVTNTVAAGKKISPLGANGEIRRNQDFAKDTVIP